MAIGKVIIGGNEKWVGFIGGGYDNSGDSNRGKGFFVVDLTSGNILWSFTRGGSTTSTTSMSMTYSIPGSAAIVDTDNDGFVDTAYIGDLGAMSGGLHSAPAQMEVAAILPTGAEDCFSPQQGLVQSL